jgi:hypothetical protein
MPDNSELGAELRFWKRIEQAQKRIRERSFRMGMAARLHTAKATAILNDTEELPWYVDVAKDQEELAIKYRQMLPTLIEHLRSQDAGCAKLWAERHTRNTLAAYHRERHQLVKLLRRFRYSLRYYERLVRQPDKPLLQEARHLLDDWERNAGRVRGLESLLRMTLQEFVEQEDQIANDLVLMDKLRAEIVSRYHGLASNVVGHLTHYGPDGMRYALCGLRKAAECYSHRHGFKFATYAVWWIRNAVQEKKTWGLE